MELGSLAQGSKFIALKKIVQARAHYSICEGQYCIEFF